MILEMKLNAKQKKITAFLSHILMVSSTIRVIFSRSIDNHLLLGTNQHIHRGCAPGSQLPGYSPIIYTFT